jgi:hypothetical protein
VAKPETLTHYDETHPYIVAMYDSQGRLRPREELVAAPGEKFTGEIIGPRKGVRSV